jgi:signal peptidase I
MRKSWLIGFSALFIGGLLSQFRLVRIGSLDMAPGLQPGDWVLLGPGRIDPGDVVRLADPNGLDRRLLRRLIGESGDRVAYSAGNLSLNNKALRIREMHRKDGWVLRSEADAWLIRKRAGSDRSNAVDVEVGAGVVFLMADARDQAIDSRWWGDVPRSDLGRKVWFRWGPSDTWRGAMSKGSADGPWLVPPPKAPSKDAIPTR